MVGLRHYFLSEPPDDGAWIADNDDVHLNDDAASNDDVHDHNHDAADDYDNLNNDSASNDDVHHHIDGAAYYYDHHIGCGPGCDDHDDLYGASWINSAANRHGNDSAPDTDYARSVQREGG